MKAAEHVLAPLLLYREGTGCANIIRLHFSFELPSLLLPLYAAWCITGTKIAKNKSSYEHQ
jgi:hypothetical protein